MRKINIKGWKSNAPKFDEDGKTIIGSEEKDEDLLDALNALIGAKDPQAMPRGLDKFRLFNRLAKAFDEADKTKVLKLEEGDYNFLKDMVTDDVPSSWGLSSNLFKAIEDFLNAKEEK